MENLCILHGSHATKHRHHLFLFQEIAAIKLQRESVFQETFIERWKCREYLGKGCSL